MNDPIIEATAVVITKIVADNAQAHATGEELNEIISELTGIPPEMMGEILGSQGDWS